MAYGTRTVADKKAEAKKTVRSKSNPFEQLNLENPHAKRAFFIWEGAKLGAELLIDLDPMNKFQYETYGNTGGGGDFGGDFPSTYREPASTRSKPISSGAKIGGSPKFNFTLTPNLDFGSRLYFDFDFTPPVQTVQELTYIYRNSQWPSWND